MKPDIDHKDFLNRCYKALCYARAAFEEIGDDYDVKIFDEDVTKILNGEKTDIENVVDFFKLDSE